MIYLAVYEVTLNISCFEYALLLALRTIMVKILFGFMDTQLCIEARVVGSWLLLNPVSEPLDATYLPSVGWSF